MVEDDVEFGSAGGDGCACFSQLGVRVLGALVEAYNAGDENVGAFEVGDAALDPVEADADGLCGVSYQFSPCDEYIQCYTQFPALSVPKTLNR